LIAEPATTLTDYALATLCAVLGHRLNAEASRTGSTRLWAAAFGAIAAAALLGGTSHGFAPSLSAAAKRGLWHSTYALIGLGNLLMLCAALSTMARPVRLTLTGAALVKFGAYLVLAVPQQDFRGVIAEVGLTLVFLLFLGAQRWLARAPGAGWLLTAVGVSFAGALVQYSRLAPHRQFNHNDLFHVVQMVAMILFHRAARVWVPERDHER
jgi:uncharacterized protein DUF6962